MTKQERERDRRTAKQTDKFKQPEDKQKNRQTSIQTSRKFDTSRHTQKEDKDRE